MSNGIEIKWSAPNQAWFVMWHGTVLRVYTKLEDVESYLDWLENSNG